MLGAARIPAVVVFGYECRSLKQMHAWFAHATWQSEARRFEQRPTEVGMAVLENHRRPMRERQAVMARKNTKSYNQRVR